MAPTTLPELRRPPLALVAALAALAVLAIPLSTLFAQSQTAPCYILGQESSLNRNTEAGIALTHP